MKNIISSIKNYYPVSDSSINELTSLLVKHEIPKKEIIIKGGVLDRKVYFIEQGITRSYCYIDNKEVTTWFSSEGDITFGLLDLYRGEPGFEYVETLENTIAYTITIDQLNQLYTTNIDIANWSRVIHQECLLALQCTRIDNLSLSAKERYEKLLAINPNICSRVNLGYIASYLGITLPTLSKIRANYSH
ncbi:MAG: cyclic nucleotide-binding domain-containing protein [Rikenellaceae bacterium]